MKISVKEKMKEAEQMSLQYPDVLYRVMDKTGQRAIVTGNSWVYRERIIDGYPSSGRRIYKRRKTV